MSNWLGFSLSPHLRIGEDFGTENQNQNHGEGSETGRNYVPSSPHPHPHPHQHLSVMPLRSDGSLCVSDSFTPQGISISIYLYIIACSNNFFLFLLITSQKGIFYFPQNNLHVHKNCFFLFLYLL